MKIIARIVMIGLAGLLMGCETMHHGGGSASSHSESSTASASSGSGSSGGSGVTIVKPATASNHQAGPVEICMETNGYTVEPAKNGVNEGKGHHHLIIDTELPPAGSPIPKDAQHVHMGDGSKCKTLDFGPGVHTIRALFAKGNHVPYDPPVTDAVFIYVTHSN